MRELLKVPAEKVFAIHSGVQQVRQAPHEVDAMAAKKLLNLDRPYLLCLSTLEPRKNFPFLVQVFERLKSFDGDLVIAGGRGWKFEPILQQFRHSQKAKRIRYLEYVDEELLPGLYAGAELFVFPSLYEGFGFTPMEAMTQGTPVVSSAGGSLPEVLGDAAVIVPGFQADAWAAEIESLLADTAKRQALRNAGFAQARKYSWEETARQTWNVYRKI
jgi:glycosyltransferase involved in cell wall biosynthesis